MNFKFDREIVTVNTTLKRKKKVWEKIKKKINLTHTVFPDNKRQTYDIPQKWGKRKTKSKMNTKKK